MTRVEWKLVAGLVVVGLAFAAAAPPVEAFHGASWTARGLAFFNGGIPFKATAFWSGQQIGNIGTVNIEIRDVSGLVLLHKNVFQAREWWEGVGFVGCIEVVEPYHMEAVAGPQLYRIDGHEANDLCTNSANDVFKGNYLGEAPLFGAGTFQLDLTVQGGDHG